ncbi:MAG: N-acetylmuramic acid 6-phosphate etherase [Firmicutes bacterium]|nr:N-acetylmuramic acid 6-phosphate etherase [Bacillota bacterium]
MDTQDEFEGLSTEESNPRSADIDLLSTLDIVKLINDEDKKVALAVEAELDHIARAVDLIVDRLSRGGRLIYIGAGSSGRLGMLDASECPPTYGMDPGTVQAIIAGGPDAAWSATEGAEDDAALGATDVARNSVGERDVVVGISASGRTPYVLGALREARARGAATVAVVCANRSPIASAADVAIEPVTGPEVITGSTRMKAGTAQKMVLNMLTTASMVRLGKVYGNLMVDVRPGNRKLVDRATRIIMAATGVGRDEARRLLAASGGCAKTAIVMQKAGVAREQAERLLEASGGHVRKALELSQSAEMLPTFRRGCR